MVVFTVWECELKKSARLGRRLHALLDHHKRVAL